MMTMIFLSEAVAKLRTYLVKRRSHPQCRSVWLIAFIATTDSIDIAHRLHSHQWIHATHWLGWLLVADSLPTALSNARFFRLRTYHAVVPVGFRYSSELHPRLLSALSRPDPSVHSRLGTCSWSHRANPWWLPWAFEANCQQPFCRSSFFVKSAPFSARNLTQSARPVEHSIIRGVIPWYFFFNFVFLP